MYSCFIPSNEDDIENRDSTLSATSNNPNPIFRIDDRSTWDGSSIAARKPEDRQTIDLELADMQNSDSAITDNKIRTTITGNKIRNTIIEEVGNPISTDIIKDSTQIDFQSNASPESLNPNLNIQRSSISNMRNSVRKSVRNSFQTLFTSSSSEKNRATESESRKTSIDNEAVTNLESNSRISKINGDSDSESSPRRTFTSSFSFRKNETPRKKSTTSKELSAITENEYDEDENDDL